MTEQDREIVEVEWFDAQSSMHSFTMQELEELQPIHTFSVGYLLIEKKDYVVIGFMDFGNGLIKHHQCIPRGMIKKIHVIRKGAKK